MNRTYTRAEIQPFVELVLEHTPGDLTPVFAGQTRREAPLISELHVVLKPDGVSVLNEQQHYRDLYADLADVLWLRKAPRVVLGTTEISASPGHIPLSITLCDQESFGAALLFATGPAELVKALQLAALKKKLHLNHAGLFVSLLTDRDQVDDGTEMNIFHKLGVPWLEPAARNAFAKPAEDEGVFEREVRSSKGDATYLVRISGNRASCPCKGFQHQHSCRHLTQVRAELGLPTPLRTDVLQ